MNRKVKAGIKYIYDPVLLDIADPPFGRPKRGDLVKVVKKFGCPPPNTMGQCYIERDGIFAGMVCTNSLISQEEWNRRK